MARVTVEDCLDGVNNRFELVLLVSRRTKQLLKGADLTIAAKKNKYIVSSLREVAAGHVGYDYNLAQGTAQVQIEAELNR